MFLTLFFLKLVFSSGDYVFDLWPDCTKEKPLRLSTHYEMVPVTVFPESYEYRISHISESGSILSNETVSKKYPFIGAYGKSLGKSYQDEGPDIIQVDVLDEKKVVVASSSKKMVFWDFTYSNLKYSGFNFSDTGLACQTIVRPISTDESLDSLTRIYEYVPRKYPSKVLDSSIGSQFQGNKELKWTFSSPGVVYFELIGLTGIMNRINSHPEYFALVCCYENSSCPTPDPSFKGVVHKMTLPIKDDIQMPFFKDQITIIENAVLFLPLGGVKPRTIRMDLPSNLSLDWEHFNYPFKPIGQKIITNDRNVIVVELTGSQWSYRNKAVGLAFKYDGYVPLCTKLDSYFRLDNGSDQHLTLIAKTVNPFPSPLPSLLNTAFEWSSISEYSSMTSYANFGFNNVPVSGGLGYWKTLDSKYGFCTPDKRKTSSEWKFDGSQLRLCIELSLFSSSNRYQDTPSLINQILKASHVDPSLFPSYFTKEEIEKETMLWNNAIEFYNDTGMGMVDIGYDGYFFKKQLELVTVVVNYTKPEWVNFDIECWSQQSLYIKYASQSKNIQMRRKSGETDDEVVMRIVDEYLSSIKSSVSEGCEDTKMVWYGVQALGDGYTYQPASSDQYLEYSFVPQPSLYLPQKNIELTSEIIRYNRMYLSSNKDISMIPMPSPGTYGQFRTDLNFDCCIQVFGGGASGIMFYGIQSVNDLNFYLLIQECIGIFSKYEDIIVNGEIGFHDFKSFDGLVLSSMKLDDRYIVSLSLRQDYSMNWKENERISGSSTYFVVLPYPFSSYLITDLRRNCDITHQSIHEDREIKLKIQGTEIPTVILIQKK